MNYKTRVTGRCRRNVQNIDVIYEHVANRCGRAIGTPISFHKFGSHLCLAHPPPNPGS